MLYSRSFGSSLVLSNRSFTVLHFMLRSVIHFELGFCEGCKACI